MVYSKGLPLTARAGKKNLSPAGKTRAAAKPPKGFKCCVKGCNIHIDTSDGIFPCEHFGPWPTEESPQFVCASCILQCCEGTTKPVIQDEYVEVWLQALIEFAKGYRTRASRKLIVEQNIQKSMKDAEQRLIRLQFEGCDPLYLSVVCSDPVRAGLFHTNIDRETAQSAVEAVVQELSAHGMDSLDDVDATVQNANQKLIAAIDRRLAYENKDYSNSEIQLVDDEVRALKKQFDKAVAVQQKVDKLMQLFQQFC